MTDVLTTAEAAERLGVPTHTIDNHVHVGNLPIHCKVRHQNRYTVGDVDALGRWLYVLHVDPVACFCEVSDPDRLGECRSCRRLVLSTVKGYKS